MTRRAAFGWARLAASALCLVCLGYRLVRGLSSPSIVGHHFFAYLTYQSNIAFAVVAAVAGVVALRRPDDPTWLTTARALVITWTVTAGVAFGIIVWQAGVRGIVIGVPWPDVVLHFALPAGSIVSWIAGPGRGRASWAVVAWGVAYPVAWGLFTLWRGQYAGWYPYYFLDPRLVTGFGEFALSSAIALAIFAGVAAALVFVSRGAPQTAPQREETDQAPPDETTKASDATAAA